MARITLTKIYSLTTSVDVEVDDKELAEGKVDFNDLLDEHYSDLLPDGDPIEDVAQVFGANGNLLEEYKL